ncbi:MAG: NlpC/P60 family protein [Coriobacteriia bacterium]|nr:NlpC/P60 family protein [Coriobacteriia bacterium]
MSFSMRQPKAMTAFAASLLLCVSLVPAAAFATPSQEKQAEADAAKAKVAKLQEKLDEAEAEYGEAQMAQQEAQAKVDEAQTAVNNAQNKIDKAQTKIDKAQSRINQIKKEIRELQDKIGERARNMYRSGSATILDVILNSSSFAEFATNWDALTQLNQSDAALVSKSKSLKVEQEQKKKELVEQKKVLQDEKAVLVEQKEILEEKEAEAAAKAADAKAIADNAQSTLNDMERTYKRLSKEAAKLLKEEQEAERRAAEEAARRAAEAANGGSEAPQNDEGGYTVATGNTVVDRAYSQMGKWYSWGAVGPNTYDCSGLVGYALTGKYSRIGTTWTFMGWERTNNPQPGDICTNTHHCGIYIGGGQYINAPHTGAQVRVDSVPSSMIYVKAPSYLRSL